MRSNAIKLQNGIIIYLFKNKRPKRLKMENELKTEILRILNETRDQIRANMKAQGINASGRTSASLHTVERDGGETLALVGGGQNAAPIPTLELGRREGKVPTGFYYIIKQWTRDKRMNFASEQERSTFAYFVARKIAAQGSLKFRDPSKRTDVYSTAAKTCASKISAIANAYVSRTIKGAFESVRVEVLRGAF